MKYEKIYSKSHGVTRGKQKILIKFKNKVINHFFLSLFMLYLRLVKSITNQKFLTIYIFVLSCFYKEKKSKF